MGTRAQVRLYQGEHCLFTLFRHFDGYPSYFGELLADILTEYTIVNGLNPSQSTPKANGAGNLALQMLHRLVQKEIDKNNGREPRLQKDWPQASNYHLKPPESPPADEEYLYEIKLPDGVLGLDESIDGGDIEIICTDLWDDDVIYEGPAREFQS